MPTLQMADIEVYINSYRGSHINPSYLQLRWIFFMLRLWQRYDTLDRAIQGKWLLTFAYYCCLFRKGNRYFHSVQYKHIAIYLRVSPQTASFHVNRMIELGLCKKNGNQLQRLTQREKSKHSFTITASTPKEVKQQLELAIVKRNIRQQRFRIEQQEAISKAKCKVNSNAPCTKKDIKLSTKSLNGSFCSDTILSGYKLSKLLKTHYTTAYRKLKSMAVRQEILIKERYEVIKDCTYQKHQYLKELEIIPRHSKFNPVLNAIFIRRVSAVCVLL